MSFLTLDAELSPKHFSSMTDSNCWIECDAIAARGAVRLADPPEETRAADLLFPIPGPCPKNGWWPSHLSDWAGRNGIPLVEEWGGDGSQIVRAAVRKDLIRDFLLYMYADDSDDYECELAELLSAVEDKLRDGVVYDLCADTW